MGGARAIQVFGFLPISRSLKSCNREWIAFYRGLSGFGNPELLQEELNDPVAGTDIPSILVAFLL